MTTDNHEVSRLIIDATLQHQIGRIQAQLNEILHADAAGEFTFQDAFRLDALRCEASQLAVKAMRQSLSAREAQKAQDAIRAVAVEVETVRALWYNTRNGDGTTSATVRLFRQQLKHESQPCEWVLRFATRLIGAEKSKRRFGQAVMDLRDDVAAARSVSFFAIALAYAKGYWCLAREAGLTAALSALWRGYQILKALK